MSTGRNIPFYDPNQNHELLYEEQLIQFSQELNELNRSLSRDVNMYRVVCVCCNDPSPVINQVQNLASVIAVWLCKEHSGSESNPTFNKKVRDDVDFDPHGQWLFDAHKLLFEAYYKSKNKGGYEKEKQILKQIQRQQSYESQSSVDATDQSDIDFDDILFGKQPE